MLDVDFASQEFTRTRLLNKTHKYGNDDDYADEIMVRIFNTCVEELDGRPDTKGGRYRVEMLPTTCHVYFGSVTGALPDGRSARYPLSEGISPVQGADRHHVAHAQDRGRLQAVFPDAVEGRGAAVERDRPDHDALVRQMDAAQLEALPVAGDAPGHDRLRGTGRLVDRVGHVRRLDPDDGDVLVCRTPSRK
jgi:hypothetical protein